MIPPKLDVKEYNLHTLIQSFVWYLSVDLLYFLKKTILPLLDYLLEMLTEPISKLVDVFAELFLTIFP